MLSANLLEGAIQESRLPLGFELEGVVLGDKIQLCALNSNRRVIPLRRTHYDFTAAQVMRQEQFGCFWTFPALESDRGTNITFKLCHFKRHDGAVIRRFVVASNQLFKINGMWCQRAFPKRGDIIDFALARFKFVSGDEEDDEKEEISPKVAASTLPVLIEGETGTGKSSLAKRIHQKSDLSGRFVHLNLSSFTPALLESELFGHRKGAFTGAIRDKRGALLEAHQGTLFLDEIDSLPKEIQTKLLLFLDEGTVRPVGDSREHKAQVRLISAAGRPLRQLVNEGKMRADFFHRLGSGVQINLRPLREEPKRIEKTVRQFAQKNHLGVCPHLIAHYQNLNWSGNFRQLLGHLNKKKVFAQGNYLRWCELDDVLLSDKMIPYRFEDGQVMSMREMKKIYVQQMLARYHNHYGCVAKLLKISENTVRFLASVGQDRRDID